MAQGLGDVSQTTGRFGDFIVTRQLAVEQGIVICRARKHDAPSVEEAEKYVVALFRGRGDEPRADGESDAPGSALEPEPQLNFIEVVKQQKKASESGATNIVPVHDFGLLPSGAWYATDYYPRGFLKKWISQRAGISEEELRHIVRSIVGSLLTLQRQCGRSHGNLAPSSILIGGKIGGSLRGAPIMLTYLAPGGGKDAPSFELADLRALGLIVYTLVCRQNIATFNPDNYPIPHSEAWSELGKADDFWLGLCNRLLDPALNLENCSLEKLANELVSKPALPIAAVGAGVALVTLLLIGAGYYWFRDKTPARTPNRPSTALEQPTGSANAIPADIKREKSGSPVGKTEPADTALPPSAGTPPTISPIPDQTVEMGQPVPTLRFTVEDREIPATNILVKGYSSNPGLIPDANILAAGAGAERMLVLRPLRDVAGNAVISLVANNGSLSATNSFTLTVKPGYAPPTLTGLGDRSVKLGTPTLQLPFQIGTNDTLAERLMIVGVSANPVFLPDKSIKIEGKGARRMLIINPVPQKTGEVILAVSAVDSQTNVTATFWFKVTP